MASTDPKKIVTGIFFAALNAVNPYNAARSYADKIKSVYEKGAFNKLVIAGFGKAAYLMAKAMETGLNGLINEGVIVTKYGHVGQQPLAIRCYEAGHPLPDENGLKGTT